MLCGPGFSKSIPAQSRSHVRHRENQNKLKGGAKEDRNCLDITRLKTPVSRTPGYHCDPNSQTPDFDVVSLSPERHGLAYGLCVVSARRRTPLSPNPPHFSPVIHIESVRQFDGNSDDLRQHTSDHGNQRIIAAMCNRITPYLQDPCNLG